MQKRLFTLVVMLTAIFASALAQVTTSGISGKVLSAGDDVIGATVTATHKPSGTVYRAVTNIDGRFSIQGMRVGGPYTVEVSYIGMETKKFENVNLTLGETEDLSCSLSNNSKELEEVVVTGQAGIDATKTGAAQSINARRISEIPTVSHSIADIARMNPQITTNGQSGAMSFAGTNNRYNAFQIDGAMNNDMFGLTSNGSNGGQAGAQPVSMETWSRFRSMLLRLTFARADSPAAPSTPSPRAVPTSFTDRPISTATTRSWWAATTSCPVVSMPTRIPTRASRCLASPSAVRS